MSLYDRVMLEFKVYDADYDRGYAEDLFIERFVVDREYDGQKGYEGVSDRYDQIEAIEKAAKKFLRDLKIRERARLNNDSWARLSAALVNVLRSVPGNKGLKAKVEQIIDAPQEALSAKALARTKFPLPKLSLLRQKVVDFSDDAYYQGDLRQSKGMVYDFIVSVLGDVDGSFADKARRKVVMLTGARGDKLEFEEEYFDDDSWASDLWLNDLDIGPLD